MLTFRQARTNVLKNLSITPYSYMLVRNNYWVHPRTTLSLLSRNTRCTLNHSYTRQVATYVSMPNTTLGGMALNTKDDITSHLNLYLTRAI